MFNLPDLRGRFLRGVDGPDLGRDPDSDARLESNRGGNTGNKVGTLQPWGTGLQPVPPEPAIAVQRAGAHTHELPFELTATRDVDDQDNTVAYDTNQTAWTEKDGDHTHRLVGGGRETRPINAAVNWIICYS